jgi:hypothetical protein
MSTWATLPNKDAPNGWGAGVGAHHFDAVAQKKHEIHL